LLEAAKRHHKVAGILAADIDTAAVYRDRGFKFIAIGSDATLLAGAISNAISQLKK
jgi:4-hydroxy-2-oxoheptanedioate aldolase